MAFYWIIFIFILGGLTTVVMAAQYSIALKHQFDEDYHPKFVINEAEVYVIGVLGGSIGLLIAYLAFPEIRKNDSFNSRRFLLISLAFLLVHALIIWLLSRFGFIIF